MELELEIYGSLCSTCQFVINGVSANSDDFGNQDDQGSEYADDYCCGDMVFERIQPDTEVLKKYGINKSEYEIIADKLEEGLSFGCCGLCS